LGVETLPGLMHIDHVALTVPDLDAAVGFYCDVLGATEFYRLGPYDSAEIPRGADGRDWGEAHINVAGARIRLAMLRLGSGAMLELFQYEKPDDARKIPPRNCDLGSHHIAMRVENLDLAVRFLRAKGIRVMDGPIVIGEGPRAGMLVNYFLDPWGNQLEVVQY
jgi:catechol 2,3-dioxygenase-like lactoylglutathione lyase family enzyme